MSDRSSTLLRLAGAIETPLNGVGKLCGGLALACVVLTFVIVVMRYLFDRSSIPMQELVLHMNAAVFLLAGAYTFVRDRHVRVDILQARWSPRTQAGVELAAIVFLLLPFAVFLLWISWDYVAAAWTIREGSREVGGLPGIYLVKTLIPLSAVLLVMAGIARALRMIARLTAAPGQAEP